MATPICKLSPLAAFLCFALLVFSAPETGLAAAVCGKPSGTWHGPCVSSSMCNDQCKLQEDAIGGACFILACRCHYLCDNP